MAHSEMYPDGSKINKFFEGTVNNVANQLAKASGEAFKNGAVSVEQHIVHGNEPCPKCASGIRFDLCCGNPDKEQPSNS